jgi:hypothetical protein
VLVSIRELLARNAKGDVIMLIASLAAAAVMQAAETPQPRIQPAVRPAAPTLQMRQAVPAPDAAPVTVVGENGLVVVGENGMRLIITNTPEGLMVVGEEGFRTIHTAGQPGVSVVGEEGFRGRIWSTPDGLSLTADQLFREDVVGEEGFRPRDAARPRRPD